MLDQERRTGLDRRQGHGAEGRKPPFLTQDGVVYADRRVRPDRRPAYPISTLSQQYIPNGD